MKDDEKTALVSFDMGGLIARAAAAGMSASVTISCFPQDELPPHPVEIEEDRRATVTGMLEPRPLAKFVLGQRVGFTTADAWGATLQLSGEIWAVTHYQDREPAYFVRPSESAAELLGHGHDVSKDEGELHAMDMAAADAPAAAGEPIDQALNREMFGRTIYVYGRLRAEPMARTRFTIHATLDQAEVYEEGNIYIGNWKPSPQRVRAATEEAPREDALAPSRRALNGKTITIFAVPDADHLDGFRIQAAVGDDVEAYDGPRLILGQFTPRFTMP